MAEKKTFKGVELGTYYPAPEIPWEWIVGGQHFKHTEWDMEVTFTKKVRPEVGGTANLAIGGPDYTVIAVSGDRVWLQDTNDEYVNFVRRFDQLVDVKPWQPA